ncbi:molecular chaperone DnaJ [Rhodovarius crocodyli]|uniref:Molecular chaperone DnaJ n=1 Tax=Rhodovarius crocodyli TaxID=1979269 RepID=A0A437MH93_9PROT|nr:J domain-containing protein [Rhodovarius crocodyli]RVT97001.1 molecular chaperone DnaJ [Rhodovarius crocodyli]
MPWLLGGFALLALGWFGLRAFVQASPAQLGRALVWFLAVLGAALLGLMLLAGRGGTAFSALILVGPALWRWFQGWRARTAFSRAGGQETGVETATLEMRLDLTTGEMRGRVRRGRFAGRDLSGLDEEGLRALLADCETTDPESVPLIEAWLDRVHPDWRSGPPLDEAQAFDLLNLSPGATEAEIKAAHRRAMLRAHPDHGGDEALAARLNAARDLLLRHRSAP